MELMSIEKFVSSGNKSPRFTLRLVKGSYYRIELASDIDFDISDLKKIVDQEKELFGKRIPVLVICPPTASTNAELMSYLKKNENNPYSAADAFVISSMAQSILANFYSKITKPERPTKFFTKEEEAISWINSLL